MTHLPQSESEILSTSPNAETVAIHRNLPLKILGYAVFLLGMTAAAFYFFVTDQDIESWKRILLPIAGLYMAYIFYNNRLGLMNPPRIGSDGIYFYKKGDLDYLMRGQFVSWTQVRSVKLRSNGLAWIEHEVEEGGQTKRRCDPLATGQYLNASQLLAALTRGARQHGLTPESVQKNPK